MIGSKLRRSTANAMQSHRGPAGWRVATGAPSGQLRAHAARGKRIIPGIPYKRPQPELRGGLPDLRAQQEW
eukprot:3602567-Lingulodinium_polyedra.AAC.1